MRVTAGSCAMNWIRSGRHGKPGGANYQELFYKQYILNILNLLVNNKNKHIRAEIFIEDY